jgi:hypothetical protein
MQTHPKRDLIHDLIQQSDDSAVAYVLIKNSTEHRMEMLLAMSERRLMDDDEAWLLERYQQSITVAAAMLFGDSEFRFLPISYDDIFCVVGPTPIADAHSSVFEQDQSVPPFEDAEAWNHARIIMAVHDAVRMLGPDNPVSLLDPDGLYDRAVYTDMIVHQYNELKRLNESDDEDATGPYIFDLQPDEELRFNVQPRALEDCIQYDLDGEAHDFDAIISSRKSWNEPDNVTDGSTDWVIVWKLSGGMIVIGDAKPFEARFIDLCFREGRTADPRLTDVPQTWSWTGEFTGRLEKPIFPYLENEEPQSITFTDMTFEVHGHGFVAIGIDGNISGWFEEPPIFAEGT